MKAREPESSVSWEEMDHLFDVYPDQGLIYWKNPIGNKADILRGSLAGNFGHKFGYVTISIRRKTYKRHRLIWFYVHKRWPTNDLDHINGDRGFDGISNLREATRAQNMWNTKAHKDSLSGKKGVSWDRRKRRWRATLMANGKRQELGYFATLEPAIQARVFAETIFHGQFARSN